MEVGKPRDSLLRYEIAIDVSKHLFSYLFKLPEPANLNTMGSNGNEMLNSILPPRQWVDDKIDNKWWVQYTSHTPASRVDVALLRESLDKRLAER